MPAKVDAFLILQLTSMGNIVHHTLVNDEGKTFVLFLI